MNELIKKLVEAYGPSGFEDGMRDLIRPEVEAYADEIRVDALGNLIAIKNGDGSGLKVARPAHDFQVAQVALTCLRRCHQDHFLRLDRFWQSIVLRVDHGGPTDDTAQHAVSGNDSRSQW